jgi:CBS-domain-containing membrane protein
VQDVMAREVVAVRGSTPFKELVRLLNVVDHGGALVGIVTRAVDGVVAVETRVGWAADDAAAQGPPSEPAPLA